MKRTLAISAIVLACGLSGCGHKTTEPSAKQETTAIPAVSTAVVKSGSIEEALPVTGTVTVLLNREAIIIPTVSAQLDSYPVRVGQQVAKGQIVAHLSTRSQVGQVEQAQATVRQNDVQIQQAQVGALQQQAQTRAAVLQAESAVSNARATLAAAQATQTGNEATLHNSSQTLARQQKLLDDGLIARKDLDAAQLAVRTAQAQLDAQRQTIEAQRQTVEGQIHALQAAKAAYLQDEIKRKDIQIARQQAANSRGALATAKAQLAQYTLKSPLAGRVIALGANLGETVDTSTKLVTIANMDQMQLQISVPSEAAARVQAGQRVSFRVDSLPGSTFQTVINLVGSQVDPATNAIPAYAIIENRTHILRDDQTAKVRIIVAHHDGALLVPKGAILTDAATGEKSVAVIGADNIVHIKKVTVGIEEGDTIEVTMGTNAGQKVAISGQYALADGTKVSVQGAP